ncbi:hypothetical protein [Methylobacterium sp. J-076]|uniref:hypothetical protein n=1 Tax=Methylobacterium sp. J-076 TaxID=2836655 RepID=UPI001FBA7030|nr:hypothetical protein [Methylobacterium sp. J-076]MCJ2015585.1 hypothetical protein [Methylobacterium sp. J-076]
MERRISDIRTNFDITGARAVIAAATNAAQNSVRTLHDYEKQADLIATALDAGGFAIVRKVVSDVDVLDLRSGVFVQDGKADPLTGYEASAWLVSMRALPVDPATRPTGEDVAIVVVMPNGESVPLTSDEYRERSEHRVNPSVPTGRTIEVMYANPDGSTFKERHMEVLREGKFHLDVSPALPTVGTKILGATVIYARETVEGPPSVKDAAAVPLEAGSVFSPPPGMKISPAAADEAFDPSSMQMKLVPGKPYSPMPIRPVPILAVFYEDGIISFAGDGNDWIAFRDMAAKVVDPSRREA